MHKSVSLLCLSYLLAAPAISFGEVTVSPNPIDLGNLTQGDITSTSFLIANKGTNPVTYSKMLLACGCTSSIQTWPVTLNPGEELRIPLQFNSKGMLGKISRGIRLEAGQQSQHISITARVYNADGFMIQPQNVVFSQDITQQEIQVISTKPIKHSFHISTPPGISVTQHTEGNITSLTIENQGFKGKQGHLLLELPSGKNIKVQLFASQESAEFEIIPESILLRGSIGEKLAQHIQVRHWRGTQNPILAIEGQPIELKPDKQGIFSFNIEVIPQKARKSYRLELVDPITREVIQQIPMLVIGTE